jgi:CRISPR-associated protein Csd1
MISEIIKYAEQKNLGSDGSDFEIKSVPWDISLTLQGTLASDPIFFDGEAKIKIINGKEKKSKTKRELSVPFTSKNEVAGGKVYHTLYGSGEILLGQSTKASAADKLEYFKKRLSEMESLCPQNASRLKAVIKFLESKSEVSSVVKYFSNNRVKLSESITFVVEGIRLVDNSEIRKAWVKLRKSQIDSIESNMNVCLVSGEYTNTVKTTESVKRIHGGLPTGVSLISFDKPSFTSYGLDRCDNAPISIESELKLRLGLQFLVDNNSIVMGDNTYLYWTKNESLIGNDIMNLLKMGDIIEVKRMLSAPISGKNEDLLTDDNMYYLVSVSPNGGRIAIKNYIMCGMSEVTTNIRKWFSDCSIVGCDRYGIESLFRSLKKQGEKYDDYNHYNNMIEAMIQAALLNYPLPNYLLSEAVRREIISKITNEKFNMSRLSLLKLCLSRKGHLMTEQLNEQSTNVAYLCGRLWAVIKRLHEQAMPHVTNSFIEKRYGSACSRPSHIFSSVLQKIQMGYYYRKANSICKGMGYNRQKEVNQLVDSIGKCGGFPISFTAEEKANFCIGYSQQEMDYTERKNKKMIDKSTTQV